MPRLHALFTLPLLLASSAVAVSVGSGASSPQIAQSFLNAYNRGQFPLLAAVPPLNDVHALGTPGLVQEFSPRAGGTAKYALVKPDPTVAVSANDTLQVYSDIYAYYTSVGVATAGYPTIDTTACPANSAGACNYQLFTKNYGLFVYAGNSVNVAVRDPFYTLWMANGGVFAVAGVALSGETTVTSPSKVQATQQLFNGATMFSYPAGSATPTVHAVPEPFNSVFNGAGGLGALGLPTSEVVFANGAGLTRQSFEYGRIEQAAGGTPTVIFNLSEVAITYASLGLNLNAGASVTISATTLDIRGTQVSDRTLTWTSTNGAVASVTGNGYMATVRAVGGGSASIYATSEGKTSAPLAVRVGAVCCGVGEGAPTPGITQAFQAAVARNSLAVALPASTPVVRQGTGYTQMLAAADGSGRAFVIALADNTSNAWVLTGNLYAAYLANGGFTGPLGYPASDPGTGGVQSFTSGAVLAGSPVRVIPGAIAARWLQLGGVTGMAGNPVGDAASYASFSGIRGVSQGFAGGMIFGNSTGQAYFSSGLILARYLALAGPGGAMGVPTGDLATVGTVQTQSFETGYIDLQPGAVAAVEHFHPRHPAISLNPATVTPGGRVHISATGFAPGATLQFAITGQPGFSVVSAAGAYAWDVVIPGGAKPAAVTISAASKPGTDAASGTYTITSVPALLPKFTLVSGDQQTGAPGAVLPLPLTAVLVDAGGAPIAGVPVSWTVSPGGSLQSSFVTDAAGRVSALFRLPAASGVAVGSFSAGGQVVEFSALGAAKTIAGFPGFAQADAQGGLTAGLAALLRYAQNTGALGIPNGSASPAALSQYLSANHGFVSSETGKAIPNPWVAARFAGGNLVAEAATLTRALDLVSAGTPLVALLNLTVDGAPGGGAAVDVTGVNGDGTLAIFDPNPAFGRAALSDYLNGFAVQGHVLKGTLGGFLRLAAAQAGSAALVVTSPVSASAAVASPLEACAALDVADPVVAGQGAAGPGGVRYHYCDSAASSWEVDLAVSKAVSVVDLAGGAVLTLPANGVLAWQVTRMGGVLSYAAQTLAISGVTDSAAFGTNLAPGGLMTIFGSGFSGASNVTVGGKAATVVATFPFQINALVPADNPPGNAVLQVTSSLGSVSKPIVISPLAPGIFVIGQNSLGAIVNFPDGVINSPANPAQRGQYVSIYAAGLGATALRGGLQTTNAGVSVVMNSVTAPSSFAGLVPGFIGLYQVNVQIPASLPPGLGGTLALQEGGQTSNPVAFAVQ